MEALPKFKYHPDPVATGSIEADTGATCSACGQARGYIYFDQFEDDVRVCPWCIADGSANRKFDIEFNDGGAMDDAPPSVMEEISCRTPGFGGWQQERWLTCCSDAAAFLGPVGAKELRRQFPEAIPAVREVLAADFEVDGRELQEYFDALDREGQPTAYLFRCLHCGGYLGYVDMT